LRAIKGASAGLRTEKTAKEKLKTNLSSPERDSKSFQTTA
jgi:hypothetical protein